MFLHINNEQSVKEIKGKVPFTIESEKIKYLEISSSKGAKDLYTENYITLLIEIKEDTNK